MLTEPKDGISFSYDITSNFPNLLSNNKKLNNNNNNKKYKIKFPKLCNKILINPDIEFIKKLDSEKPISELMEREISLQNQKNFIEVTKFINLILDNIINNLHSKVNNKNIFLKMRQKSIDKFARCVIILAVNR